jgi:hypothetical protein
MINLTIMDINHQIMDINYQFKNMRVMLYFDIIIFHQLLTKINTIAIIEVPCINVVNKLLKLYLFIII